MSAYWSMNGNHLVQAKDENREGVKAIELLQSAILDHVRGNLLDFGCGKGRMARLCQPERYLGYDINAGLIEQARSDNPTYNFTNELQAALSYDADATLMYTVISMWGDYEAGAILSLIQSRLIIIGEIADKRWATASYATPPIYNRDVVQFDAMMHRNGYVPIDHRKAEHERYASWNNPYDKHMHIIVYAREGRTTIDDIREQHIWGARADGTR